MKTNIFDPLFITVTGKKSGTKVRINVSNCTKIRENDGGTGFYTDKNNEQPYMLARETPEEVDKLIEKARELANRPVYTLKP